MASRCICFVFFAFPFSFSFLSFILLYLLYWSLYHIVMCLFYRKWTLHCIVLWCILRNGLSRDRHLIERTNWLRSTPPSPSSLPPTLFYTNTNIQIHKYTNTQIHKYTNIQIHKHTNKKPWSYRLGCKIAWDRKFFTPCHPEPGVVR